MLMTWPPNPRGLRFFRIGLDADEYPVDCYVPHSGESEGSDSSPGPWINCGAGVFANSTVGSFVQPIVLVPPTPQSEGDARRLDQPLAMPRRFPGHRGTWNPTRAPNLCAAPQLGRVGTRWQCQSIRGWNPHKEVPLSRPMNTQNGSQSSSHSCEHT